VISICFNLTEFCGVGVGLSLLFGCLYGGGEVDIEVDVINGEHEHGYVYVLYAYSVGVWYYFRPILWLLGFFLACLAFLLERS